MSRLSVTSIGEYLLILLQELVKLLEKGISSGDAIGDASNNKGTELILKVIHANTS